MLSGASLLSYSLYFIGYLIAFQLVPSLFRANLYDGLWDEEHIRSLYTPSSGGDEMEGYVVRLADSFSYRAFRHSVAKYVRADHDRTRPLWFHGQPVVPNALGQLQAKGES